MSSRGSETRRAQGDPERSGIWQDRCYDENPSWQRREASTSTQGSGSWLWVPDAPKEETGSSAGESHAPSSEAWTLWKDVDKAKYRTEKGADTRSGSRRSWNPQEYREPTCDRSEQDCPAREWERYPEDEQVPKYTQDEKRHDPLWQSTSRYQAWKSSSWVTHESVAKSESGSHWRTGGIWSDQGSWPAARETPTAQPNVSFAEVDEVLAGMDVPAIVKFGDWACPYGHFNAGNLWKCGRCKREDKWVSTDPDQRFKIAVDDASIAELRDFVQRSKLGLNLTRPSSQEIAEQAAAAAELSAEEVLEARDAESDVGVPAPSRCKLSAEQQTELLRHMFEKQKELQQGATRASDSSVRSAGEGDAASERSAGSAAERFSDTMSFKSAVESQLSRQDKRQQRVQQFREARRPNAVFLPKECHNRRQQAAAMLMSEPQTLSHLSEKEFDRLYGMLLTQNVDVISGGTVCVTRLMGSVEMIPEVRDGVEGTLLRVTVATQAEAFLTTRDPRELDVQKAAVAGALIDKAVQAVAKVGQKDGAEQRMLRTLLKGELRMANFSKTPGVKDLTLVGFGGSAEERTAKASMALGKLMKAPESRFSPLEDFVDAIEEDRAHEGERMRKYADAALVSLGLTMELPEEAASLPPPALDSGRDKARSSNEPPEVEVEIEIDEERQVPPWDFRQTVGFRWSSVWQCSERFTGFPMQVTWNKNLGTPPYMEMAMWPLYRAGVEAGNPGKLCAEGFILFEAYWIASEEAQGSFWTAFMALANAFTKKEKIEVDQLPKGAEDYWVHGDDPTPDLSAERALRPQVPLVEWSRGPIIPFRKLMSIDPKFAPPHYKARLENGNYGAYDLKMAAHAVNMSDLETIQEHDLVEEIDRFHPPVRYQSFNVAMLEEETWHTYVTPEVLERQAHTCLRIEVVTAAPHERESHEEA